MSAPADNLLPCDGIVRLHLVLRLDHGGPLGGHHGDLHPARPVLGDLPEGGVGNGQARFVRIAEERGRLGVAQAQILPQSQARAGKRERKEQHR
mgnify:CR=1 FL=1